MRLIDLMVDLDRRVSALGWTVSDVQSKVDAGVYVQGFGGGQKYLMRGNVAHDAHLTIRRTDCGLPTANQVGRLLELLAECCEPGWVFEAARLHPDTEGFVLLTVHSVALNAR